MIVKSPVVDKNPADCRPIRIICFLIPPFRLIFFSFPFVIRQEGRWMTTFMRWGQNASTPWQRIWLYAILGYSLRSGLGGSGSVFGQSSRWTLRLLRAWRSLSSDFQTPETIKMMKSVWERESVRRPITNEMMYWHTYTHSHEDQKETKTIDKRKLRAIKKKEIHKMKKRDNVFQQIHSHILYRHTSFWELYISLCRRITRTIFFWFFCSSPNNSENCTFKFKWR